MKTFLTTLSLVAVLLLALAAPIRAQDAEVNPNADDGVSFQTFYDQLSSQGTWVQTEKYGNVFQPTENDPNWRPYTYGHWVQTDQGMTWMSDDSFGWATDHYGRWTNIDGYGWVWVPGYTWAPAWVSWREDADNVGWAPLPPASDQGIDYFAADDYYSDPYAGYGYHIGSDCDVAFGIGPWWYNFCPIVYIGDRDCWRHFRDRRDNFGFIHHTRNVTNINFRRNGEGRFGRVRAEGPNVAALNQHARTPIARGQLAAAANQREAGLHGNNLNVFAPKVAPSTIRTARPTSIAQTVTNTNVNRGTDINKPVAVNSRITPASPSATQVQAAANPYAGNNNARVATPNTQVTHPWTQTAATLRADTRAHPQGYSTSTPGAVSHANPFVSSAPNAVSHTNPYNNVSAPNAVTRINPSGATTSPAVTHQASIMPRTDTSFSSQAQRQVPHRTTQVYPGTSSGVPAQSFQQSSPYRTSAPAFRQTAPASTFHAQPQQAFRQSSPVSMPHYSAPAAASVPHYSAPAVSVPASHVSGGGAPSGRNPYAGGGGGGGMRGHH